MSKSIKILLGQLGFLGSLGLLVSCTPRVATSFWRIGTPADSTRDGYAVLYEGKKMRHCYPVTEWTDTINHKSETIVPLEGKEILNHKSEIINHKSKDTYHSFHHHGVAVESDLMAYRIYFDKKQTVDPYCKRTPQLELANSYWYPNDSLLAAGYGDDILRVSGTVGVGSVKYWNGKLRHIEKVAERSQRIVKQTRNSATIEVADKGWEIPQSDFSNPKSQLVDMSVQYTLRAGHRDMRCDVFLSDTLSGLCTGVQSIPAKGPNQQSEIINLKLENGVLLASWGTDWPVNDSAKYAKETVGLAVFIPYPYAGTLVHDKSNNLCLLNLTAKRPDSDNGLTAKRPEICHAHFYLTCVGATKENHPVASSATEWFTYLRQWAAQLR